MASAKLMASSISRNSDLKRKSSSSASTKSSISDLQIYRQNSINNNSTTLGLSMTVDGILRNVYSDDNRASESTLVDSEITLIDAASAVTAISDNEGTGEIRRQERGRPKTVDDVWREIVAGRRENKQCKQEAQEVSEMMTLEDFLAKADAAEKEDVKVEPPTERLSSGVFAFDQAMIVSERSGEGLMRFGSGVEETGGGRGKRRALLEPLDKAAQQRQRRMIKNRESAARSRERKQAYQVELESMAVKLEEENELLLKEKAERTKERFKQITESATVVVDGVSEWKDPTVQIGDSIIFEHKNHYNLYIFQNRRAFNLCNFTQATLLNKPNSTSYTWHPSRLGFFYFSFNNGSTKPCQEGQKLAIKVSFSQPENSPPQPPMAAPPISSAYPWPFRPRDSTSPSPAHTSSIISAISPSMGPDNKGGDGIPFINSNPAVPLPTGEVDSATIGPLPISGDHRLQVVGFHQVERALCFMLFFVLL